MWVKDDTGNVRFSNCFDVNDHTLLRDFESKHGRTSACLAIPEFNGINLPSGIFVGDLSKFGKIGDVARPGDAPSTIRAGFIIEPLPSAEGRSVTTSNRQGRNFAGIELVVWDESTMTVLAGPINLKTKSPDILYATNNCEKEGGLFPIIKIPGRCDQLNPTLSPKRMFEVKQN
jgi:hypothetical protein